MGKGYSASAPEYATLTTTVVSVCFDSAAEAKEANLAVSSRLQRILETYRRIEKDRVLSEKTSALKQNEPSEDGKTLCEGKWRTAQSHTLHLAQLALLADLQNELLAIAAETPAASTAKQTYLVLGQPSFHLSEETYARLKREAQEQAWADARSQFDALDRRCQFASTRLSDSTPPSWNAFSRTFSSDTASSPRTAVVPDEILAEAVWKFVWAIEGASCGKEASQPSP